MSNLKLATTDELLKELTSRTKAFAIAYEMPQNGEEAEIHLELGMEDFNTTVGLFYRLLSRVELCLAQDAMDMIEPDEDEEEEEPWQTT